MAVGVRCAEGIHIAPAVWWGEISARNAYEFERHRVAGAGGRDTTELKARHVMNRLVTAATPRAVGRDLGLQLRLGMYSGPAGGGWHGQGARRTGHANV